MPLYDYTCPQGCILRDELVSVEECDNPRACARHSAPLTRRTVYRTHVVGPVWSALEAAERDLLGPTRLRRGERLRDGKSIAKAQQELYDQCGLRPVAPGSVEERRINESAQDDLNQQLRIYKEAGGGEAGNAAIDEWDTMMSATHDHGMSDAAYVNYRNARDAIFSDPARLDALADAVPDSGLDSGLDAE